MSRLVGEHRAGRHVPALDHQLESGDAPGERNNRVVAAVEHEDVDLLGVLHRGPEPVDQNAAA